jgi:hypothetical protein
MPENQEKKIAIKICYLEDSLRYTLIMKEVGREE